MKVITDTTDTSKKGGEKLAKKLPKIYYKFTIVNYIILLLLYYYYYIYNKSVGDFLQVSVVYERKPYPTVRQNYIKIGNFLNCLSRKKVSVTPFLKKSIKSILKGFFQAE